MKRSEANKILSLCFDLCQQAIDQGVSSVEKFNAWLDLQEKEFEKKHRYVDEDHNKKVRITCQKIFFLALKGVPGFENRETFHKSLEKV
jgi:hypothetical protein